MVCSRRTRLRSSAMSCSSSAFSLRERACAQTPIIDSNSNSAYRRRRSAARRKSAHPSVLLSGRCCLLLPDLLRAPEVLALVCLLAPGGFAELLAFQSSPRLLRSGAGFLALVCCVLRLLVIRSAGHCSGWAAELAGASVQGGCVERAQVRRPSCRVDALPSELFSFC